MRAEPIGSRTLRLDMLMRPFSRWTRLVQPKFSGKDNFKSLAAGVERASTVVFDSVQKLRTRDWRDRKQYTYGLLGTPTIRRLEDALAEIDGVEFAMLFPSGLSAISHAMLALLQSGDRVLMPINAYQPGLDAAKYLATQFGVELGFYDPMRPEALELPDNTRLLWVETPGSVTMEVADLPALAAKARQRGVLVGVDTTWPAGIALPVFELGADFAVHALTKYPSGGSDVLMGSITTASETIYRKITDTAIRLGSGVSPEDCSLLLRSLPHYRLRYEAQDRAARQIAEWLQQQPQIQQVLHPALENAPGHAVWVRDFSAAASLFSIVFRPEFSQAQVDRFVESLQLFHLGFSWGGAVSLAVPYTREQLHQGFAFQGALVRLYIGLEQPEDLIADLQHALAEMKG